MTAFEEKTKGESMSSEALTVPSDEPRVSFTRDQVELIKRTICKGGSDDELQLFLGVCRRTELDPLLRQIYAVRRWDSREKREIMQPQASIDGFRLVASRSGKYEGQVGPFWCGEDGAWRDVWIPDEPPVAAKVGVLKAGCREPFWSVAKYTEYVQTDRDGNPLSMWRKMPANQLAKCAEALSLRKAFPQELSGLYTPDEMAQADADPPAARAPEPAKDASAPWANYKEMIVQFSKLRGRLGTEHDHFYQEILSQFAVRHSNQFRDRATAAAAYRALLAKVEELEAANHAASGEPDVAVEDEPEAAHVE
jgi:phage recombination protein Bet